MSRACREGVVVIDMSFMSKFLVSGRDAGVCLNRCVLYVLYLATTVVDSFSSTQILKCWCYKNYVHILMGIFKVLYNKISMCIFFCVLDYPLQMLTLTYRPMSMLRASSHTPRYHSNSLYNFFLPHHGMRYVLLFQLSG